MNAILIVIGLAAGFALPWLVAWLVFVYPYSTLSLKPLLWSFAAGLPLGVIALFALLSVWAGVWPKD